MIDIAGLPLGDIDESDYVEGPNPKVSAKGMAYAKQQVAELEAAYRAALEDLNTGSTLEEYYDWEMAAACFDADLTGFCTIVNTGHDRWGYLAHLEGMYE